MIDGILLINKEKGITSYDVIRQLKRIFPKGQKIGHAGTLDPFATGLLIVLLGKGTKLMNHFHTLNKEYVVKGEFGYSTDTQDCTGSVVDSVTDLRCVSKEELEDKIKCCFLGDIEQVPPAYSAKKISGKKAYDLARSGRSVEIKPVSVHIFSYDVVSYNWPFVEFKVVCSTGTYIRTLINDLGNCLGIYATAVELERIRIGDFSVENSVSLESSTADSVINSVINLDNLVL